MTVSGVGLSSGAGARLVLLAAQDAAAGADTFVAGSAIFGKDDYAAVIQQMRDELAEA